MRSASAANATVVSVRFICMLLCVPKLQFRLTMNGEKCRLSGRRAIRIALYSLSDQTNHSNNGPVLYFLSFHGFPRGGKQQRRNSLETVTVIDLKFPR